MLTRHARYIQRFACESARSASAAMMAPRRAPKQRATDAAQPSGVLANLPRTRPQRSSARRDAARARRPRCASAHRRRRTQATPAAAQRQATAEAKRPTSATKAERPAAKKRPSTPPKSKATAKRLQEPAPRQGFESEGDRASGPVQPPGGVELVASAAELVGELAKAGLSTGERLLKDCLSRLPLS